MAKSKLVENHTLKFEGFLDTDDMCVEIDELGYKDLKDLLEKFNGCNVKVSVSLSNEILE